MGECMRLYPVLTHGTTRSLGKDVETSEGYTLPKGSIVFMPFILILRDPNVYDNPDSFIPSRWENPTKDMNDSYIPFSAGPQNCVGQSLVNANFMSAVYELCAKFELELVDEGYIDYFLTLKPRRTMIKAKSLL